MKRVSLLLLAALLGLSASALHMTAAKPVHADTACAAGETPGSIYFDGYTSRSVTIYGADGSPHTLNLDLASYHEGALGNCYRAYYASTWFSDHAFGYQRPELAVYTDYGGIRGPWMFNHGVSWDWGNYVWSGSGSVCETCNVQGPWSSFEVNYTLPNGAVVPLGFGLSTSHRGAATAGPCAYCSADTHVYDNANPPAWEAWSWNGIATGWYAQFWELVG